MSGVTPDAQEALEVTVTGPVVSFRDPMYAAVALCLPCPPPATVGGLLAAAAGGWAEVAEDLTFAMAFTARGTGVDLETYHPLDYRGRPAEPGPRDRHFLAGTTLTVWLLDDVELWWRRLRRPVWPLRLGRSQDLVAVESRRVELRRGAGRQDTAVVPATVPGVRGRLLQLPTAVSLDRARTRWDGYRHRSSGRGQGQAYRPVDGDPILDGFWVTDDGRAVVPLPPVHPVHAEPGARVTGNAIRIRGVPDDGTNAGADGGTDSGTEGGADARARAGKGPGDVDDGVLGGVLAKSTGERLTDHLAATCAAVGAVRARVGRLPGAVMADVGERFWTAAALAGLAHDAGKVADGFQRMLRDGTAWGHRHEVLSLGFLPWLVADPADPDLLDWVALGVATHHRPISGDEGPPSLRALYGGCSTTELESLFGHVGDTAVRELVAWLRAKSEAIRDAEVGVPVPNLAGNIDVDPRMLVSQVRDLLERLFEAWGWGDAPVGRGLAAVLLQGAVTFADHLSSAHGNLRGAQPFGAAYRAALQRRFADDGRVLYPHQAAAAEVDGHLVLRAYTGSGKTEAGLLWASRQVEALAGGSGELNGVDGAGKPGVPGGSDRAGDTGGPGSSAGCGGVPRLFYTLPYLASINAMAGRLARDVDVVLSSAGTSASASASVGAGAGAGRDGGGPGSEGNEETGADLVGVSHSRSASYYLTASLADEADESDEVAASGGNRRGCTSGTPQETPTRKQREKAAAKAVGRANATRLFRETVRVGTPYQQLRGALAGPAHSSILLDSANSVFVLDELHSYDPRRLGYILASVELWVRLGGRVAVLSATLPTPLVDLVRAVLGGDGDGGRDGGQAGTSAAASSSSTTTGVPVTVVEADHRAAPVRHRVRIADAHLTDPRVVAAMAERLDSGQSVLVVANNVADAQALYGELAPAARERFGDDAARLLHSRFRRCDRTKIEADIVTRYRAGAPPAERRPGLVVATQVVEVSLDVDFDVLFTSAAPLDALAQRFGRVNRVGERPPADVVVCPADMRRRRGGGPAEFADGVYEREPTDLAWSQLTRHDGDVVSEAALVDWLDEVYASDWGERWQGEVEGFRDTFDIRMLDFSHPFGDRSGAEKQFDELFDGAEAVLAEDVDNFAEALRSAPGRRAGRLLAEDYLLPLPAYARSFPRWDKKLGVAVVDGDYDSERGLLSLRGPQRDVYAAGEVI